MKTVDTRYKQLRTQIGAFYEIQVVCNNTEYGNDRLKSVKIHTALYDGNGVSIGNAYSSSCEIQLLEQSANWPRMAQFTVRVRLSNADGRRKSDWLDMGTFYTDERLEDTYGNLSITGYDRMLMTEQYWTDKIPEQQMPSEWPITSRAWVSLMESVNLIEVDQSTVLDNQVALIGLNTASTIRDKLKDIAAAHGGNWVVTPEGKLKLVYFHNIVDGQAAIAGIAITGVSVAGDDLIESAAGLDLNFLGMNVQRFENSPALQAISRVHLETEGGVVSEYGDDPNGYMLTGSCEFANNIGPAELCHGKVAGYVYKPFAAEKALLDPAAEVGDLVIIDGKSYQMMTIDWNLTSWPTADISAPYDAEVDHEYKILSPEAKSYRKAVASTDNKLKNYAQISEFGTLIEQNSNSVVLAASQTYVNITNYNETIQNLQDQISGTITQYSGDPVPSLSNYPAVDWETEEELKQHVGALYLVTAGEQRGQYYRFEQSGNSFNWVLVEDSALATALANAAAAQEAAAQAQADADQAIADAAAAQGTADQARQDAVAKAAEAAAAAATAAAVDATNKANDALAAAKKYAEDQVTNFIEGDYHDDLEGIRGQLDRKIETYYQTADPSKSWPEEEKADHFGDLWYNMGDQLYYRWDGTGWEEMTANPPKKVFDTLDGKARVFVSTPVPPYSVGDIWTQGPNGDILRCVRNRAEGELYVTSEDWVLASKYTDDRNLEAFISGKFAEMVDAIKNQIDQKAETYYQETDPSIDENGQTRWNTVAGVAIAGLAIVGSTYGGHTGDLWYNTTDDTTWYWDGTQWVEQTISREVFDTIDGKAQIFVSQPTKDDDYYEPGDIWVNATYSDGNVSYNNDILRCINPKAKGTAFSIGDWQLASKYTDDSALTNFVNSVYNPAIESIGIELDGKVDTYFYGYEPTEENLPYSKWIEDSVNLDDHIDDIFYNTATGFAYRFTKSGNTYAWVRIKDSDITSAMDAASKAQDTADGKRRVFVTQPTDAQAYDEGDLWVNAEYGTTYTNELLRCKKAKKAGTAFSINDWERASKYTDDSALRTFLDGYSGTLTNVRGQIDQKIETWYQNSDPSTAWTTPVLKSSHVGDLWYNTKNGVNTTSRWDGTQWVQQNAPKAVFDQIDGKAQIFVSQPEPPYQEGDLWVQGDSGDILRCKAGVERQTGSFVAADWELASKYTDDTAVENLEIGGRNLILKTGTKKEATATSADGVYTDYYYFSAYGQAILAGNTTDYITVSFDYSVENATASGTTPVRLYPQINRAMGAAPAVNVSGNEVGHYEESFKLNTTQATYSNSYRIRFRLQYAAVGARMEISNLKVEKSSKATTWTAAPEDIEADLDSLRETVEANFKVNTNGINARVTRTGNNEAKSFSWSLTEEAHVWKKKVNGVETEVLRIDGTGLHVNGDGTFSGTVSAATITGGTINIGNGNFVVSSTGQLTAKSGTFEGSVYAGSILSGSGQGYDYGYFHGSGITAGSITAAYDANWNPTGQLSAGVGQSLGYANGYHAATRPNSGSYPAYFHADQIVSSSSFYGPSYTYAIDADHDCELVRHYHTISVSNGKVTIGAPANPATAPSFDINDLISSITPVFGA